MKKTAYIILTILFFLSCHESIEERAAREAREYTEKFCPTPVVNYTRTDSVTFNKTTKTYNYYCSVTDMMDDQNIINKNHNNIKDGLLKGIMQNTEIRTYKKAGFTFAYTLYSSSRPGLILFKATYTPQDYNK